MSEGVAGFCIGILFCVITELTIESWFLQGMRIYKQGFIDGATGKQTYVLKKNEQGETVWERNRE